MSTQKDLLIKKLRARNYSLTAPRLLIFEILHGSEPITMKELINKTNNTVDRATVYRVVETLESIGAIHRLNVGWKYKLELSEDFHGHHHHLICTSCGDIIHSRENIGLENAINESIKNTGFIMQDHNLEITGTCQSCQHLS